MSSSAQRDQMSAAPGFVAALDQSGGSTPKALQLYGSAAPVNGKAQWTINFTPGPVTIRALCYDPMATGVLTMPIIVE